MNVAGSLFSGIGGLDEGLRRAGWRHDFLCESDEYRRAVLAARFPGVPCYEDVVRIGESAGGSPANRLCAATDERGREAWSGLPIDLLCGGFPCQDLSVAGRRAGLAGKRSSLFYEFARVAESLRPSWLLLENVPGLLSSNGGRDFGELLGTMANLGYGLAWRILDSRFFGVPQRRRRVFILGALADDDPRAAAERAGEVLAVGSRCQRHPATRGETGASVAPALSGRSPSRLDDQGSGQLVAGTLGGGAGERGWAQDTERMTFVASPLSHGSNPNSNMAGRRREDDVNLVTTFDWQAADSEQTWIHDQPGVTRSLSASKTLAMQQAQTVRRLTPCECERLQALPDDWTLIPWNGKPAPDSRRYAALGDAVTTTVAEWIGRRLLKEEAA